MVTAKDVMTPNLITVNRRDILKKVVEKMFKHNVRCLPVVDTNDNFIGFASHEDILRGIVLEGHSDFMQVLGATSSNQKLAVTPKTPIKKVIELMNREHARRIAVLQGKKIIGIITQTDIIQYESSLEKKQ